MHRKTLLPRSLIAVALLLLPASGRAQEMLLPEGPAGRAWAGVGRETPSRTLTPEDLPPGLGDARWDEAQPWLAWARLVRAEGDAASAGEAADGRRRAQLALIAWQQNRSDDAWEHLAACTAEPGWMEATIPHLLPGVPLDLLLAGGANSGVGLPAGIVLRPALPPPAVHVSEIVLGTGRIRSSEMTITNQRIGDAIVSLHFILEYDGIQVDIEHLSGEPTVFWMQLPVPPDFEIGVQYLDWLRADEVGQALKIELDAGKPVRHLFGRYRPRKIDWPTEPPAIFGARFERHGLRLAIEADDPWQARLTGLASGFGLLLGCEVALVVGDPQAPAEAWPGVTLNLRESAQRERKLMALISLSERFALGGGRIAKH